MRTIEECINDIKRIYPHYMDDRFIKRLNEILEIHKAEKRPKGKWITYEVKLPDRIIFNYKCSVCGRKLVGYSTDTLKDAPHCHCGANMIERKVKP